MPREPIELRFPAPSVMGVINVTPDSFSDGGVNLRTEAAVTTAWGMLEAGASIIGQVRRTKNCIVSGPRNSPRPMPCSLAGSLTK